MAQLIHVGGQRDRPPTGDVVFVHGLDGHVRSTWTNRTGDFWPQWLADDHPHIAVWSVGYEAAASAWRGTAMPLFDRANHVLATLQAAELGHRPICFVAHSLGGLLVKQMLRNADSLASEFRPFSVATRGVVFLGTPHTGSDLARLARYLGVLLRSTIATRELEALASPLLELNTWYRENVDRLGVATQAYFENQTTKGIVVVDRGSADPSLKDVAVIGLDANHAGMCKPASRDDLPYTRTRAFILHALSATSEAQSAGEHIRSQHHLSVKARTADDAASQWAQDSVPSLARPMPAQTAQGGLVAEVVARTKPSLPLVRDLQPEDVGVHRAVAPSPGLRYRPVGANTRGGGQAPTYVRRSHDARLQDGLRAAAMRGHGLVILIGRSSSGKSRSAWEAVRAEFPDWAFADCRDPATLSDLAHRQLPTPDMVIWLDDLRGPELAADRHLAGNLRALFEAARQSRMVAVATSWPDPAWETGGPHEPVQPGSGRSSLLEVAKLAREFGGDGKLTLDVNVEEDWDPDELARAAAIAGDDPYIEMALSYQDFGPTQVLAGAPWLERRWQQPRRRETKAILTAAIDLSRLGLSAISEQLLQACASGYLQRPSMLARTWFADALAEATTPIHDAVRALIPIPVLDDVQGGTDAVSWSEYRLCDLLQDYGQQQRHWEPVPKGTWHELTRALLSVETLTRLAELARSRMLYGLAEQFQAATRQAQIAAAPGPGRPSPPSSSLPVPAPAPTAGAPPDTPVGPRAPGLVDLTAPQRARAVADQLRRERDLAGLRALAMSSKDRYVRRRLALLLIELGDEKGLLDLAVYSRQARRELVEMLARQGRIQDLLRQVVCGNGFANRALESGWTITNLTDSERARILRNGLKPDGTVAALPD